MVSYASLFVEFSVQDRNGAGFCSSFRGQWHERTRPPLVACKLRRSVHQPTSGYRRRPASNEPNFFPYILHRRLFSMVPEPSYRTTPLASERGGKRRRRILDDQSNSLTFHNIRQRLCHALRTILVYSRTILAKVFMILFRNHWDGGEEVDDVLSEIPANDASNNCGKVNCVKKFHSNRGEDRRDCTSEDS